MKIIKYSTLLATFFTFSLILGCSSKPTTKIDFNPKTNFASFTNFQFSPAPQTTIDSNPIMSSRIKSAVEQNLLGQGLIKIDYLGKQSADLTISVNFSQQEKPNNSSFSIGFGTGRMGSNGGGSIGVSTTVPIDSDATFITKIIIDMSHHGKAVWHGVDSYEAKGNIPTEELNNAVSITVNRMLANFPPKEVTDSK